MTIDIINTTLRLQIKHLLHENPGIAKNKNSLIISVWKLCGLKLSRRQVIQMFLLPTPSMIDATIEAIKDSDDAIAQVFNDDSTGGMKYETTPSPLDAKPRKIGDRIQKIVKSGGKKVKVK
jgi:hypothetical protein